MAATELAKAYVQIIPSAEGISGSLTNLLSGEAASAGVASGTSIGTKLLSSLKAALPAVSIAAIGAAIVKGLKASVEESMVFDTAMSQIAATMGTTVDQISDLETAAKQMGATTAFSATEAAEGLNILAMSGLSASEQIEALPTVLNLASAGALSLDSAASYVTGTIKGFGDSMDNAEYYADLMAKGATLANTNVADLGEALSGASATANAYGQSAEGVVVSLLKLAEQNVTGSEATTKLNRAMADLYTPTDAAKAALEELGVACYDSEGKARDFNDITEELTAALADYDDETANAYKDTIFTTNGLDAFNKMAATSTDKTNEFKEALADASGSAMQQAQTQIDNLQGDITLFQSAMSGLKITVGQALTPALRSITQFGTEAVSVFTDLITFNFDSLGERVSNIQSAFMNFDWQGLGDTIKNRIIDGIKMIVNDVPATISEFVQSMSSYIESVDWGEMGYKAMQILINGFRNILSDLGGFVSDFAQSIGQTLMNTDWAQVGYTLMTTVLTGIKMIIIDLPTALSEFATAAIDYLTNVDWLSLGQNIVQGIINGIINFIPNLISSVVSLAQGFIDAFKNFFGIASPSTVMQQQGQYLVEGIINGITGLPAEMLNILTTALNNVLTWGGNIATNAKTAAANFLTNVSSSMNQLPSKMQTQLTSALTNVKTWGTNTATNFKTYASNAVTNANTYFSQLPGKVSSQLSSITSYASSWGSSLTSSFKSIGKNVMQGLINGISGMVSSLYSSIKSALSGLVSKAKSALGIKSPSTVFRNEVGEMIGAGLALGIDDSTGAVESAMDDLLAATDTDAAGVAVSYAMADPEIAAVPSSGITSGMTLSEQIEGFNANFEQLFTILEQYFPQFANMQMVMDSGAVVGELARPMNTALGKLAIAGARGR